MKKIVFSSSLKKSISNSLGLAEDQKQQASVFKEIEKSLLNGILHKAENTKLANNQTHLWKKKTKRLEDATTELLNTLNNICEDTEDLYAELIDNGLFFSDETGNLINPQLVLQNIKSTCLVLNEKFDSSSGAPHLTSREIFLDDMISIFIKQQGHKKGKEAETFIKICLLLAKDNKLVPSIPKEIRKLEVIKYYKSRTKLRSGK